MKSAVSLLCCICALAGYGWWQLRDSALMDRVSSEEEVSSYEIAWLDWEPGLFEAERAKGRVVWLSYHADW